MWNGILRFLFMNVIGIGMDGLPNLIKWPLFVWTDKTAGVLKVSVLYEWSDPRKKMPYYVVMESAFLFINPEQENSKYIRTFYARHILLILLVFQKDSKIDLFELQLRNLLLEIFMSRHKEKKRRKKSISTSWNYKNAVNIYKASITQASEIGIIEKSAI